MTQPQALTKGGLVDLDHRGTGLLEVVHLVANSERNLPANGFARQVVAHKGPVEDGDRSGSMPFNGFSVRDCAYFHQPTVIGFGRDTSPKIIGGHT
jgi:hypothetical protein